MPRIEPARQLRGRQCLGRAFKLLTIMRRRDLLSLRQCLRQLKFVNQQAADRHYRSPARPPLPRPTTPQQSAWELLQRIMKDNRVSDDVKMQCWRACPHEAFPCNWRQS
jgi:hypothetical protein